MAEYFARKFRVAVPEYLTCGVDTSAPTRPEILDEYKLRPKEYFLTVCRIEPENNVDVIVRGFLRLSTAKRLVVVGGVNYRSQYFEKLKRVHDERVLFTGPVYEDGHVDSLLKHCYAYIDGHEVGGTSPGLLRAMARGCCVLVLNKPFNAEVVGEAGVLWERDEQDLAEKMASLLKDPASAESYGRQALNRVREEYSWESVVDAHERFFLRTVGKHGRGE
jgi:glycosyltransferase involved in cell wall biosynthesis